MSSKHHVINRPSGCVGWPAPFLFALVKSSFSHDKAKFMQLSKFFRFIISPSGRICICMAILGA